MKHASFVHGASYTLLPTSDANEKIARDFQMTCFDYELPSQQGQNLRTDKYRSIFTYNSSTVDVDNFNKVHVKPFNNLASLFCHQFLVICCCSFLVITAPFTLWFFLKKIPAYERAIVFRLGRLQPIKGPGFICIFPLIDRWKRISLRMRAYSIPPQQLMLSDGTIVELGAEIRFRISNVIKSVTRIQNLEDSVRSLGRTVLVNFVQQKSMSELNGERADINEKIQLELNAATGPWGLEVSRVEMTPVKVLHEGTGRPSPLGSLMSSLQTALFDAAPKITHSSDASIPTSVKVASSANSEIYDIMVDRVFPLVLGIGDPSSGAIYKLQVSGDASGGTYWLDTKRGKTSTGEMPRGWEDPDVTVSISAEEFLAILNGGTSPLQAYMDGNIRVIGNAYLLHNLRGIFNKLPKDTSGTTQKQIQVV